MTGATPSHSSSAGVIVSLAAPTEERNRWTPADQLIGIWVAWTVFALALIYVAVMTLGFIAAGSLDAPLVDPAFAIMEILILVQAPLIVLLTVGRQVPSGQLTGFDWLFSFNWPSVAYALDILAWDYCFGPPCWRRRPSSWAGAQSERCARA